MTLLLRRVALSALPVLLIASTLWGQAQQPEIRTGIWRGFNVTYTWIPGKDGTGKAIYQGDILLDHVEESPNPTQVYGVGVAYSQYLWPKVGSVYQVPYIIDPASGDTANINTAIAQFNSTFTGVIQFVAHTTETDYVDFNLDQSNNSGVCESSEGRVGGEQFATGAGGTQNPCCLLYTSPSPRD